MNPAIVTTSINTAPPAYAQWAQAGKLIVAGDLNTPDTLENYVRDLGGVYLSPEAQSIYEFSATIGWKNIQRRNAAIMHAYALGHDPIVTVDDDNFPVGDPVAWMGAHIEELDRERKIETVVGSRSQFLNPGMFCLPRFHGRGVPYGIDVNSPVIYPVQPSYPLRVVVSQAQVLGDPDCHAVERIANHPDVKAVQADVIIAPGCYVAFNSQATVWSRDWAPVMGVLPGIGRHDDIFASFIFHRLAVEYTVALHLGLPAVKQERNVHNLEADLRAELWGMERTFEFTQRLGAAHISRDMPIHQAYAELIEGASDMLPEQTVKFANEWVRAWRDRG